MDRRTIYALIAAIILLTFENCRTGEAALVQTEDNLSENILVRYGQYLYEREDCASCHTQQVDEASPALVSLDGLGGKYSNEWHYLYFADPSALVFDSQKDDYLPLYEGSLNRSTLERIAKSEARKFDQEALDELWKNLQLQANIVASSAVYNAADEDARADQEVLALIAYLQQIPRSARQRELDSIQANRLFTDEAAWEEITLDSNSIIFQIAEAPGEHLVGQRLFKGRCSVCHGQVGEGGIGPNLTDDYWLHGGQTLDLARTIVYGVPEKGMISWKSQLSPQQVGEIVGYVKSIRGTNPQPAKAPQGKLEQG